MDESNIESYIKEHYTGKEMERLLALIEKFHRMDVIKKILVSTPAEQLMQEVLDAAS